MTSLYKTAYPYYSDKKKIAEEIIFKDYRLAYDEIKMVKTHISDNINNQLCYGVLLMVFKNLNYFPETNLIPKNIVDYIKDQLSIPHAVLDPSHPSTMTRIRKRIYDYYGIIPCRHSKISNNGELIYPAQDFIKEIAVQAAQAHNYPADIINVVVEQCKKNYVELPAFNHLDRLVKQEKIAVNQQLFETAYASMVQKTVFTKTIKKLKYHLDIGEKYKEMHNFKARILEPSKKK